MPSELINCPSCKHESLLRVLFGYPTTQDFDGPFLFGGEPTSESLPTHGCESCGYAFYSEQHDSIVVPFPSACHFCNAAMDDKDKFVFQTEFDTWTQVDESPFLLEYGTFSDVPFPLCGCCREEIHLNEKVMLEERNFVEKWGDRLLFAHSLMLIFVLIVILISIFGF